MILPHFVAKIGRRALSARRFVCYNDVWKSVVIKTD